MSMRVNRLGRWGMAAVLFALALLAHARAARAQAVEFDALVGSAKDGEDHLPEGSAWTRVNVFEVIAGVRAANPFYREVVGYLGFRDGRAHVVLGATDIDAFRAAFRLDEHPDQNMFARTLVITIEICRFVIKGKNGGVDRCDEGRRAPWSLVGDDLPLHAAPMAMTVARVPLAALPPEVVLQSKLDAALAAEAAARRAAIRAIEAGNDAEIARAKAAEAALAGDVLAESAARQAAVDAEALARQTSDSALASSNAALQLALAAEAQARQTTDGALDAAAETRVAALRASLADKFGGYYDNTVVSWSNLINLPIDCPPGMAVGGVTGGLPNGVLSQFDCRPTVLLSALCPFGSFVQGFRSDGSYDCREPLQHPVHLQFLHAYSASVNNCDPGGGSFFAYVSCPAGHAVGCTGSAGGAAFQGTSNDGLGCSAEASRAFLSPNCGFVHVEVACILFFQ